MPIVGRKLGKQENSMLTFQNSILQQSMSQKILLEHAGDNSEEDEEGGESQRQLNLGFKPKMVTI